MSTEVTEQQMTGVPPDQLPAGYVELPEGLAIHVAELRKYTTDLERFTNFLPLVEEFDTLVVHPEAWEVRFRQLVPDSRSVLEETMDELSRIYEAFVDELRDEERSSDTPPTYFMVER